MQARVGQLNVADTSDEESDEEELMPIRLIPVASSTPSHGLSIGSEMKTSIVSDCDHKLLLSRLFHKQSNLYGNVPEQHFRVLCMFILCMLFGLLV